MKQSDRKWWIEKLWIPVALLLLAGIGWVIKEKLVRTSAQAPTLLSTTQNASGDFRGATLNAPLNMVGNLTQTSVTNFYGPQPRRITSKQKEAILSRVKNVGGERVKVLCSSANPETVQYAADLAGLLNAAGFRAELPPPYGLMVTGGIPETGLSFAVNREKYPPSVPSLQIALAEAGVAAEWYDLGDPNTLTLYVGRRP